MDVNQYIKTKLGQDVTIYEVFKTGGSVFCDNCHDTDYVIIINEPIFNKRRFFDKDNNIDYIIHTKEYRSKLLNFEIINIDSLFMIDEYFKSTTTVFDLLGNKDKYINMLREVVPQYLINPNKSWEGSDRFCHRHLWWAIIGLMMIDNNSTQITDEMKNIIRACHNRVLDKEWEAWTLNHLNKGENKA